MPLKSFQNIEVEKLDNEFLTLQTSMENIMLSSRDNFHKINHLNKKKFCQQKLLPQNMACNLKAIL